MKDYKKLINLQEKGLIIDSFSFTMVMWNGTILKWKKDS